MATPSKRHLGISLILAIQLITVTGFCSVNSCNDVLTTPASTAISGELISKAERIEKVRYSILNSPSATVEMKEFVNSPLFKRFARADETIEIADKIKQLQFDEYLDLHGDWYRLKLENDPSAGNFQRVETENGVMRVGLQQFGATQELALVFKYIASKRNDSRDRLKVGEVNSLPDFYFIKALVGGIIAFYEIRDLYPSNKSYMLIAIGIVNGDIQDTLSQRLGLESRPFIPRSKEEAEINDYQDTLASGIDPDLIRVKSAKDFFFKIK